MNKKAQMANVGMIIMLFVGVIVGVALLQSSAQQVGNSINTVTLANSSVTLGAESASVYITDYKSISDVVIYNATGTLVPADNYTVTNNVVYNGQEAIQITTGAVNAYANDSANISGVAQPLGYVPESGSRTIVGLIVLFGALAIAIIVVGPSLKELTGIGV